MSQPTAPALRRQERGGQSSVVSCQLLRTTDNGQRANHDDLLYAVEANDDLATFAASHPCAAIRDAAGELAELRQAGDELLLYASEVQHED